MDKTELLEKTLDRYSVRYNPARSGEQSVSCPNTQMHSNNDKHPSARINLTKGLFYCMGCGLKGDGYSIIMGIENLDFAAAREALGTVFVETESDWLL